MKKIDWYILKKFLGTFFFAIIIFAVLSVVIDITEKMDEFIENKLTAGYIVMHYYIGFVPHILALLAPLFIFISVIFFTSKMAYRTEIIAILSTGVSYRRFSRAYWVGGIFLALLIGYSNHSVVPKADHIRVNFENTYIGRHKVDDIVLKNLHMRVDSFRYINMDHYYNSGKYGTGFKMESIDGETLLSRLEGRSINWDSTKHLWRVRQVVTREIQPEGIKITKKTDSLIDINLAPKDLISTSNQIQAMTTKELNEYIEHQKLRSTGGLNYLYVERYRRTASAFSIIILTMIGMVIASRKIRGGSGLHLALGIVISAVYILFMQFSTTFSIKGNLNPFLSVWIPNFVFGLLAIILYRKAPK